MKPDEMGIAMSQQTGFIHSVYFWLRDGAGPAAAQELSRGCGQYLGGIPGVLRMSVGYPAGTDRSVVDNSFGLLLLVEFSDSAAHDAYQEHPDHLLFIATCSHLWSRVQVYDAIPLPA